MEKLYQYLPEELVTFILVTVFSLLIGLSLRRISLKREGETTLFGTDRTFTFIGILGYLLYILDPTDYRLFMGGGAVLGLLLALNYYVKQAQFHVFGVTTIIIALITYCIAPIVATQPSWFYVMVIVTVLLFTELKHTFTELAQRMKNDEMITLAKFLAISGIILPMLPDDNLIPGINLALQYMAGYGGGFGHLLSFLSAEKIRIPQEHHADRQQHRRHIFGCFLGGYFPTFARQYGYGGSAAVQPAYNAGYQNTGLAEKSESIRPGSTRICGGDAVGGQHDVLAVSYPDRNIQYRGFDSHLSVFADNVCRCCRDGVVPAFPVEASCHVGNGR